MSYINRMRLTLLKNKNDKTQCEMINAHESYLGQ